MLTAAKYEKLMKMNLVKIADLQIRIRKEDDGKRTITHLQGSPDGVTYYCVIPDKNKKGQYSLFHGNPLTQKGVEP